MYRTKLRWNSMHMPAFIEKYQDKEKFIVFCRECHNYGNRWSCPPLSMNTEDFLQQFSQIYLFGTQVIYTEETRSSADTKEKVQNITRTSLQTVKQHMQTNILHTEKQTPGSVSFASGSCSICPVCTRPENKPCRHPDKMRHSLDSFGFDLTAITQDLMQVSLQWSHGELPEYYLLVHALLCREPLPQERLEQLLEALRSLQEG